MNLDRCDPGYFEDNNYLGISLPFPPRVADARGGAGPAKNVGRLISEYVDREKVLYFLH